MYFLSQMKTTCLLIGFSLAFGALVSETWRVYKIFTDIKVGKKPVKDSQLIAVVLALVLANVALLVSWELIDPRTTELVDVSVSESRDVTLITRMERCSSPYMAVFIAVILALQGLMLLLGTFLAYETRKVGQ